MRTITWSGFWDERSVLISQCIFIQWWTRYTSTITNDKKRAPCSFLADPSYSPRCHGDNTILASYVRRSDSIAEQVLVASSFHSMGRAIFRISRFFYILPVILKISLELQRIGLMPKITFIRMYVMGMVICFTERLTYWSFLLCNDMWFAWSTNSNNLCCDNVEFRSAYKGAIVHCKLFIFK